MIDESVTEDDHAAAPEPGRLPAHVERWAFFVGFAAIVVWVLSASWAAFRGFDPYDEAWYIITYRDARPDDPLATAAPFIIRPFFEMLSGSVVGLRLLKLLTWLALGTYVGTSTAVWINATPGMRRVSPPAVGAVFATSGMVVYAVYPPTPSYNDLAVGLLLVIVALTLRLCVLDADSRRPYIVIGAVGGACMVLLGLSKATTGVVAVASAVLLLVFGSPWPAPWMRRWVLVFGSIFGGAIACLLFVHVFIVDLVAFTEASRWAADVAQRTTVPWAAVWDREDYTLDVHFRLMRTDFGALVLALLLAAVLSVARRGSLAKLVLAFAAALFAVVVVVEQYQVGGYRSLQTQPVAISALVVVSLALGVVAVVARRGPPPRVIGVLTLMTVLPYAQGLGSNVPYMWLAVSVAPLWLIVAVVALAAQPGGERSFAGGLLVAGVWALAMCISWTGLVSSPTRVWTPLWDQTEEVAGHELGGVRVDPATAEHFNAVAVAVRSYSEGSAAPMVLGFNDLPGAVVAADASTLAGGWFYSFYPERSDAVLERACAEPSWRERASEPLVLIRDFALTDEVLASLGQCGIDFPDGYVAVERFEQPRGYYPYVEGVTLWVPVDGADQSGAAGGVSVP